MKWKIKICQLSQKMNELPEYSELIIFQNNTNSYGNFL